MKLDRESKTILTICVVASIILTVMLSCEAKASDLPTPVTSYVSEEGESMDAFALRIAPDAVDQSLSPAVGGEVCGEFRRDADRYVIDLYTTRKLESCNYFRKRGHDYTGLTFHTHITIGEANRDKRHLTRFSQEDYDHPGYMATSRRVMFQNGRGTDRRLASQ